MRSVDSHGAAACGGLQIAGCHQRTRRGSSGPRTVSPPAATAVAAAAATPVQGQRHAGGALHRNKAGTRRWRLTCDGGYLCRHWRRIPETARGCVVQLLCRFSSLQIILAQRFVHCLNTWPVYET